MRRLHAALLPLLGAALLASGPSFHATAAPQLPWRTPLHEDLSAALLLACPGGSCRVLEVSREPIDRRVVHYSIKLGIGPEPTDVIRLHRVVRENRRWFPRKSRTAIFLHHGEAKRFEGVFLPGAGSSALPGGFGLAAHLAANRLDVWGIDQAWTLVPAGTADFSFMEGWGIQRQADELSLGLAVARAVRQLGGNRSGPLHLLAYGRGAITGFALLDQEARRPPGERNVNGFIPVDMTFRTSNEKLRSAMCDEARALDDLHARGVHRSEVFMCALGDLCSCNPGGASPFFPGMNNHQAALYLASGPMFDGTEIHQLAGIFDGDGLPMDLLHTPAKAWMEYMATAVPHEPVRFLTEVSHLLCQDVDYPFDDALDRVDVPVLYLAAAGGIGVHGLHGLHFLEDAQVSVHLVQLEAPARVGRDFGHLDLLTAPSAPELAWEPLLDWIRDRR